ncbi:MAG: hypothetical protein WBM48_01505 [Polyangiales bacterium]|jgi:hypothetical protein
MRFATLASLLTAGVLWLALGSASVQSQADEKAASCQTCGQASAGCPHCAAKKDCPHCTQGKDCPHCKGEKACPHCAKGKSCTHCGHHGQHGKWGAHKWDYKCVRPPKKPVEMTKQFKALGEDGWRLVEADGGIWCFSKMKRAQ